MSNSMNHQTALVWSPIEFTLHSSVAYENPFTATEIDAVFTHADGTRMAVPGFWKGGDLWAVRFTPVKAGEWAYTITCKDPANRGLTAGGSVTAAEAVGDTELSRRGFVTAVKGQRYYQYADGTPFFWLGDTNWQAFTNVSTTVCNYPWCGCGSQFKHIVDDRVGKGFTVYQTYFVPESGNGERPLWLDPDFHVPDVELFNNKIDRMFDYLHERGMVIALGLGCHGSTMGCMPLAEFLAFTRMIVARYACYSIVWITGQEITGLGASCTPGHTIFDCYVKAAELVDELDGYNHPNSAHMDPMPATDERAVRMDTGRWHDTWTVQGGHGNRKSPLVGYMQSKKFYRSYYDACGSGACKAFIESESNYEDINCGPFTGYDANRIGAWRAMLCGSAGFTYGVSGIWAGCFSTSRFTGWYGGLNSYSYEPWYMTLDKPGCFEVVYMKDFFQAIGPWYTLRPRFSEVADALGLDREDCLLSATEDGALAVVYLYGNEEYPVTVRCLDESRCYDAYWFDPRTGQYLPVATGLTPAEGCFALPAKPTRDDWVFLLTSMGLGAHAEEAYPVDLNPDYACTTPTGTPVTPISVTAVGGITYSGDDKAHQVMFDPTARLWDGDPTTAWEPSAHRTTQTILFDLGEVRELTHITITPAAGTVIPHFRVEGSNNHRSWTILTDTSLRSAQFPGVGSEPLTGGYRYVKVLLLNAEDLTEAVDFETIHNPMNDADYSVTRITDITIYFDRER